MLSARLFAVDRPIRVGVIGAGGMGRHHVRVYDDLDNVDLVAVADPHEPTLSAAVRRREARGYQNYHDMIFHEQLDAVSVVVPTSLHYPVAMDVMAAGVSVLVEKPIAMDVRQAREMIALANEKMVHLSVGHIERFNPAVRELMCHLKEGALGPIFQVKARRTGPFPARIRDAGVAIDLATHDIDLMGKIVESPVVSVFGETTRNVHTSHEDMLSALLRFQNGVIGSLDVNWLTPNKVRDLTVIGARGMFVVDYLMQDLLFYENGIAREGWDHLQRLTGVSEGQMVRLVTNRTEPLVAELTSFIAAVRNATEPEVTGEDGLRALSIAEMILQSSSCHNAVGGLGGIELSAA